jgi:hypothetical protein
VVEIRFKDLGYVFYSGNVLYLQVLVGSGDAGLPGADDTPDGAARQVERVAGAGVGHLALPPHTYLLYIYSTLLPFSSWSVRLSHLDFIEP